MRAGSAEQSRRPMAGGRRARDRAGWQRGSRFHAVAAAVAVPVAASSRSARAWSQRAVGYVRKCVPCPAFAEPFALASPRRFPRARGRRRRGEDRYMAR